MERAKKGFLYYFLRVLAVTALLCSLGITAFLCWNSLRAGDESSAISTGVSNFIKESLNVKDNDIYVPLTSIECPMHNDSRFIGTVEKMEIIYTPSNATNQDLTYASQDSSIIAVDEKGILTFKKYGSTEIVVTSKENSEISITVLISSNGKEAEYLTDTYPTFSSDAPCYELKEGAVLPLKLRTTDNEILSVLSLDVTSSNEEVLTFNELLDVVALRDGEATITAISKKTGDSKTYNITVSDNPTFVLPRAYSFKEDVLEVYLGSRLIPEENIASVEPLNASADVAFCNISVDDESILKVGAGFLRAEEVGETRVVFYSLAYGTEFSFKVNVIEHVPTELNILGNDRITKNGFNYQAFGDDYYVNNVTWEVLSGNATVDKEGVLTPTGYGTVVLKATSNVNIEATATLEIQVSAFSNFGSFVRKIIGHFSAFFALGVGYTVSYFLLIKNKKNYFPLALLTTFIIAGVTEILQLPIFVLGRGPSAGDAWLDFTGAFLGVIFTTVLYFIVMGTIRVFSKKKYEKVKEIVFRLNGKNLFSIENNHF